MENLNREIDRLSSSKDVKELAARMQNILRVMSYYISQSEGAILEDREGWHSEYSEALYESAGMPTTAVGPPKKVSARKVATSRAVFGDSETPRREPHHHKTVQKTKALRSPAADIPKSLQAIMNGSHSSFRE